MDILKNRNPRALLGSFDGKVGALATLGGENYFIATNTDYVPALPSLQVPHKIFLRSDMRYGMDDPMLWPQQYSVCYCHFPAIARKGACPELAMMWWNPSPQDFVVGSAVTRGLGRLRPHHVDRFLPFVNKIVGLCRELRSTSRTPISPLFGELIQSILMLIEQLQTLPTTYPKMVFAVTSLQRACLELDALYNYITLYKPRIDDYLSAPPNKSSLSALTPLSPCIGAFTTIPAVAQQLWCARLPFWFLRPTFVFDCENILSVVALEQPDFDVSDLYGEGAPPVVYTTANTTKGKIAAIHSAAAQSPWYRDPSDTGDSTPALASPPASPSKPAAPVTSTSGQVTRSNTKRPEYKPYPSKSPRKPHGQGPAVAKGPAKIERDKFQILAVPEMPPSIAAWADALARVDQSVSPITNDPKRRRYVFPEPALLLNTMPDRQRKYLHHWTLLRDGFTYTLTQPEHSQLLTAQQWRDILEGLITKRGQPNSKTYRRSAELEEHIRPALQACNLTSIEGFPVAQEFVPEFSLAQMREIVWQDRVEEVKTCFAGHMLIRAPLEMSKRGFAAEKLEQRHRYFVRAATLMLDWMTKSPRPTVITRGFIDHVDWTPTQMESLETAVCQYYTQAFWEHFGRAAVVSLRLDHSLEKEEGKI
ncbi:hypothetical protein B0H10DRAFT_1950900 [Mycena sp. CBHHK59/15]|nr:hypothetical protein B0H10DRAFT_1950900 [Mycena sp. CBHHK59/15]